MAEEAGKNYVGLNALYNYGGVVVYDTIFDADEDIIISCLMSSPSGASNFETQNNPLLLTEDNKLLDLNVPKDFDNFTVFLMDARVPLLTGGGASTACESFTLSSVGNTLNEFWFSAGVTLTAQRTNHQFIDFNYDFRNFNQWSSGHVEAGSLDHVMVTPYNLGPTAGFGQNLGWCIHVTTSTGSRRQALFSGSSAANAMPWDVEYWYPGADTVANYGNINPSPTFNNFNGPGQGTNLQSTTATVDRLNNPGAGLVAQRSQNQDSSFTLVNTFTALSGLLVMACYDRNGAFSLSGSMTQYRNVGSETIDYGSADYGNTDALTATQDKFAVRVASPQYTGHTVENSITSFPFLGSTDMPEIVADGGDYEVMRVGFRRRLQEVLIYERENNLYEPKEVFYTGFPTNNDAIAKGRKVRVGISYNGKMPFSIKNFTVNAVSGNNN